MAATMVVTGAIVAGPRAARGDEGLHAAATATAGFTNNVLGVPDSVDADGTVVRADGFVALRPALIFIQEQDRFVQIASYAVNARMYVQETGASSYSGQLAWQALLGLSPRSELSLSAGLTHGQFGNFGIAASPTATPIEAQPQGDVMFVSERLDASYARQLTHDWQFFQGLGGGGFHPIGRENSPGSNFAANASLELVRNFERDALSFGVTAHYLAARRSDIMPIPEDRIHALIAGPRFRWLRDLSDELSGQIGAGVVAVAPAQDIEEPTLHPTAIASLSYVRDPGTVSLTYQHTVQPNLFIGETAETDIVELRGGLPIPGAKDWTITGTAGYRHARYLDLDVGVDDGSSNLVVVDGEVTWQVRNDLALGGRLQVFEQVFDREMPSPVTDINRVQFLISATVRFPPETKERTLDRTRLRVDSQDRDPIGLGIGSDGAEDGRD